MRSSAPLHGIGILVGVGSNQVISINYFVYDFVLYSEVRLSGVIDFEVAF